MFKLFQITKDVVGDRIKTLILPICLSCLDAFFNMMLFSVMILTIIDLVNQDFTQAKLQTYSLGLLVIFIIRVLVYAYNYNQTQFRGADITAYLRLSLGNHIRKLNLGYFNKNSIGKLSSTFTTNIQDFEQVLTHSLTDLFRAIFFSILAIVFAFIIDLKFALIITILILVSLPLLGIGGKVSMARGAKLKESVNVVISRIIEYVNGIKTFRLYNLTGERFLRLTNSFAVLKKESILLELSIMPFAIIFSILTSMIIPLALFMGGSMLKNGELNTQYFIALIMLSISLSTMMSSLGSLYPSMNYLLKSGQIILELKNQKPLPYTVKELAQVNGNIQFENVSFSYNDQVEVLHDLSFKIQENTTTALVGPSGSGKSTIISLISRFWDVNKGQIKLDDIDIATINPDDLTEHLSVVFQDVYLLNDTIKANIKIGKPNATDQDVIAAAKAAQCHDFISSLENGYDTIVGEGGSTLSGGEKQRISIARALIKDAKIVLLDESTSSLDADNETEINKALDRLMQNKTVIVIAHRLNTIVNANNIIVLDQGQIIEQGNHQQLLANQGWYANMIDEQNKARNWLV